mmetsp:Transcript_95574/g.270412  ORF Transcript_95574/g.270412 Transcript_95574/m.270412 type:complete len:404 (+) Transcript_95574:94-1305(+)
MAPAIGFASSGLALMVFVAPFSAVVAAAVEGHGVPTHKAAALRTETLPRIAQVMHGHERTFMKAASTASALEQRFAEMREDLARQTRKLKAEYEQQLQAQVQENSRLRRANAKIAAAIKVTQKGNLMLRKQSSKLAEENEDRRNKFKKAISSTAIAQEFANRTLENATSLLNFAPEVGVLAELSAQDKALGEARLHEARLKDVGGNLDLSMLQLQVDLQSNPHQNEDPANLLEALSSSLKDLAGEQNSSDTLMREAFETQYNANVKEHTTLLEQQTQLNATRSAEEALRAKLLAAKAKLTATNTDLKRRSAAFQAFTSRFRRTSHAAIKKNAVHQPHHIQRGKNLREQKVKVSGATSVTLEAQKPEVATRDAKPASTKKVATPVSASMIQEPQGKFWLSWLVR